MPGILGSEVALQLKKITDDESNNKKFTTLMVSADSVYGIDDLIDNTLLKPLDLQVVKD